jgi:hypothetical protein
MTNEPQMTTGELIEALNQGLNNEEIAEMFGYSRVQTISEKISQLKADGYRILDSTTQVDAGAGIQVTFDSDTMDEAIGDRYDLQDNLDYERFPFRGTIRIVVRPPGKMPDNIAGYKMTQTTKDGGRSVYIAQRELQELGFTDPSSIFVDKVPDPQDEGGGDIKIKFSNMRVIPESDGSED